MQAARDWKQVMSAHRQRGFTLIEIMIVVAILAIIAAVALPSYRAYVMRSRVPVAFDMLTSYAARMEQAYQDTGRYDSAGAPGTCVPAVPTGNNFTLTCVAANAGQSYIATATGSGTMNGYTFTIDNTGVRATTAHPNGTNAGCWSMKGSVCDS